MKQLLLSILIFYCSFCFGQKNVPADDQIFWLTDEGDMIADVSPSWPQPELDTVKVILLVSDISRPYFHACYWEFGYSVREKHNDNQDSDGSWMCASCPDYWRHLYYLDEKRNPLGENIIVWQSRPRP